MRIGSVSFARKLSVAVVVILSGLVFAPIVHAAPDAPQSCELPDGGAGFQSADPTSVDLDPQGVQQAIDYAASHNRLSVQIFRNNCRVAAGPLDPITDSVPTPLWSSTKSVVSLLTGIAREQGHLDLDDAIDTYLPAGPQWGDAAHRAITIRNLLTQTSGLAEAIASEALSVIVDPNIAQEALAQPLTHAPGSHFEYSQRPVDLLAYVVQRAVEQDLQDYAQANLFGPLGIDRGSYTWLRDQSNLSYGYANLFMPPAQYAKLGLLLQNDGVWNGAHVIPADYVNELKAPTPTNGCYGLLFWTNAGDSCTGPNFPATETVAHQMIPSAPRDLFALVGFMHQNNFVIPSLNMTVTWTGVLGDADPKIGTLLSASGGESDLYYNFFRILMHAVKDVSVPDPGPFVSTPGSPPFDVNNILDPAVLQRDLFPNPTCTVLRCDPAPEGP